MNASDIQEWIDHLNDDKEYNRELWCELKPLEDQMKDLDDIEKYYQQAEYYNRILPEKYNIPPQSIGKLIQAKKEESPMRYLNWKNLMCIIKVEMPRRIEVGCKEDWRATHGVVYDNYNWIQTSTGDYWVMSIWDKPVAKVYLDDTREYEWWDGLTSDIDYQEFNEETYQGDNTRIIQYYRDNVESRAKEFQKKPYKKGEWWK